jgi:molybdopterin synthase catalytic subunit
MTIRPLQPHDRERWIELRHALWPDHPLAELRAEAAAYNTLLRETVFVADRGDGAIAGFVEVSLRPYAKGCVSSPVGYVEGWYVEPDCRRRGVGRALIDAAAAWARAQGCGELASDRDADNLLSRAAHVALGFLPADRCELFNKRLASPPPLDTTRDFIGIVPYELDAGTITGLVSDDGAAGGIAVFLGTTRDETSGDGRALVALDYEAYVEMADAQLRKLAAEARQRWPVIKLAIVHRVGRVEIGKPSVVIAVACPHRGEAFDACRWIIDTLKNHVAIWKKEVWADGSGTWVHPQTPPTRL